MYIFNLIFSIFLSYIGDKYKCKKITLFFILVLWSFIIGFQYNVGADYFSYLKAFENKDLALRYLNLKEYIFYYFIYFYQKIFLNGQYAFFIIAMLQNYLFYKILKLSKVKKYSIFIILFLCICTIFHNQMNGIRQYFTIYIFTLATIYILIDCYFKLSFIFLIGIGIHKSLILLFPFLLSFKFIKKLNKKKILLLFILMLIFIFIPFKNIIFKLLEYTPYKNYIYYKNTEIFNDLEIKYILSKLIYFPIYILSINNKKNFKLNSFKEKIYAIGLISYVLKIMLLKNMILARIGDYFTILSLFPIYYYLENLYNRKQLKKLFIIISYILSIYIFKILTFYKYNSYFFK